MPMSLHPLSLLITAAVLVPNLLFLIFPPANAEKHGPAVDPRLFTILERVGQVSCFLLPLFFPLSFAGPLVAAAWILMAVFLGLYYAGWIRYLHGGRDYALLFTPMIGIPIPMAVCPVAIFFLASIVLGSICPAMAAVILAVGHLTITARTANRITKAASGPSALPRRR
jgi:hypothetical protein